ncbi:MAG: glycogen synthase [Gemmatimonadetes bacterium]|jgi:starch synthase|nr:glycogen synthase [Gemmatimonadota bacterium]
MTVPQVAPERGAVIAEPKTPVKPTPPQPATPPLMLPDGRRVRVIHLVAELAPFARSGGLGEAVASLARFQAASGVPAAIMMPLYSIVRETAPAIEPVGPAFRVQVGSRIEPARLWRLAKRPDDPRVGTEVYFIESNEYFDRPYLYGPPGSDYPDNARRYACFCMAALAAIPRIAGSDPVILHAHDWHTALAPVYLRTLFAGDVRYGWVSVVLTVHNAGYQGHFPPETMADIGLPASLYNTRQMEWYGRVNLLKGGLVFADAVTTVSQTHAHELRTPAGGFGLDGVFRALRDRFVGITNGIDQRRWNPSTDPVIPTHYSAEDLEGKERCRVALQQETGLRAMSGVPIFAMTARLVSQKGLDLILGDPGYFALDAQFLFLGAGEPRYEAALSAIAARAPSRISVQLRFTEELEHKLLAGADMCLMPSQYEPCGLTQMRAQRYGTLPIARRVGGLADTIEDNVTGFLFDDYEAADFMRAAVRAVDQYKDPEGWRNMMREAMARDFGWEQSAAKYLNLYRRVVQASVSR